MKSRKTLFRTSRILEELQRQNTLSVKALARTLGVSEETIRRDARTMELQGTVIKLHGMLTLPQHLGEASFERRMRDNAAAKQAIARSAVTMVDDGDSLIIDTGTTTTFFAQELRQKRNLTVITNSTEIARLLVSSPGNRVFLAGGELSAYDGAAYGASTAEFIARFNPKFAFISIGGISAVHGPTDATLAEAEFGRIAFRTASYNVILCDSSKFGQTSLIKVCPFTEVDMIITETAPDDQLKELLAAKEVKMLVSATA
jgi:DeoR family glycerol-3-phosphate regulon repressor